MADSSTMVTNNKLKCLVADSAAFIRNVDLHNLAEGVFTIPDVVSEIKDATTRQRLAVLPYDLTFREPSIESINFVTNFSKKTGDFKSLSAVDIRVLALAFQLEKQFGCPENIRQEPSRKKEIVGKSKVHLDKNIAGFYSKPKKLEDLNEDAKDEGNLEENNLHGDTDNNNEDLLENCGEVDVESEYMEDDGGGWITPGNIKQVKQEMGVDEEMSIEEAGIQCACLTTDFAMQNVLIQMGLHVLSVQGRLIRQARNFIQKCFGCNKETHDMEKLFCPACGNKTLTKISVTINEDGTIQYHLPRRRRNMNIRGTKYSLPNPKGGRHSEQPLLVEDQRPNQTLLPKKKDQINPLDPDFTSQANPFAQNDINSRAFHLNLHVKNRQPRNPNETKKKKSGRKKR